MAQARLELLADSRQVRGARRDLDSLNRSGGQAEKTTRLLGRAFIALAGAISVREVGRLSDAYTNLQNQLRIVTKDSQNLLAVTESLTDVAARTRTDIESTGELYAKLARSTQELGLTQGELVDITETINKSFASAGATAQEASNAIRQLGQGLSAGALRGEEFNSVAEQAPGILRAVAEETGKSVGELREFAAQGGITTDLLVRALRNYGATADQEFNKTNATISQSTTVLVNRFTDLVGAFNESSGAAESASGAISSVSGAVERVTESIRSGEISTVFNAQLEIISGDVIYTTNLIRSEFQLLFNQIGDGSDQAGEFIAEAFTNIVPNIRSAIQLATIELAAFVDKVGILFGNLGDLLNPFDDVDFDEAFQNYADGLDQIDKVRLSMIESILEENKKNKENADIAIQQSEAKVRQYRKEREERAALLDETVSGTGAVQDDGGGVATGKAADAFAKLQGKLGIETAENPQVAELEAQLQERLDLIKEYRELENANKQEADQAELDARQAYQDELTRIDEEAAEKRAAFAQQSTRSTLTAFGDFFGNLAEIARNGGEESFEAYKVLASAQAGISAALAVLQVYSDATIPTFLKFPLSATIAGLAAAQIAQIQSASYSGARALGGQVMGGGSYLVGERGPELFTPNSSGSGRITPFNQLMSESREGAGNQIINNDTFELNVTMPPDQSLQNWAINNRDLFYNIIRDAKAQRGEAF